MSAPRPSRRMERLHIPENAARRPSAQHPDHLHLEPLQHRAGGLATQMAGLRHGCSRGGRSRPSGTSQSRCQYTGFRLAMDGTAHT